MSAEPSYETRRIDHLGIVAGVCREISLIDQINSQVRGSERKVNCGQGAQAMILNALGFVGRALYLTPGYLDNKPVDVLIGEDVSAAEHFLNPLAPRLSLQVICGVGQLEDAILGQLLYNLNESLKIFRIKILGRVKLKQ